MKTPTLNTALASTQGSFAAGSQTPDGRVSSNKAKPPLHSPRRNKESGSPPRAIAPRTVGGSPVIPTARRKSTTAQVQAGPGRNRRKSEPGKLRAVQQQLANSYNKAEFEDDTTDLNLSLASSKRLLKRTHSSSEVLQNESRNVFIRSSFELLETHQSATDELDEILEVAATHTDESADETSDTAADKLKEMTERLKVLRTMLDFSYGGRKGRNVSRDSGCGCDIKAGMLAVGFRSAGGRELQWKQCEWSSY